MRRLAYISSPYRSVSEEKVEMNIIRAIKCGKKAKKLGYLPFIPHINIAKIMNNEEDPIELCLEYLRKCDVIIICEESITMGMSDEIVDAIRQGKEVLILKGERLIRMYGPKGERNER